MLFFRKSRYPLFGIMPGAFGGRGWAASAAWAQACPRKQIARARRNCDFSPALRMCRDEREHAQRASRAVLDLARRRHDHGASRRKLVEIAQALKAFPPAAMQEVMRRIGRIEMTGLAGI